MILSKFVPNFTFWDAENVSSLETIIIYIGQIVKETNPQFDIPCFFNLISSCLCSEYFISVSLSLTQCCYKVVNELINASKLDNPTIFFSQISYISNDDVECDGDADETDIDEDHDINIESNINNKIIERQNSRFNEVNIFSILIMK